MSERAENTCASLEFAERILCQNFMRLGRTFKSLYVDEERQRYCDMLEEEDGKDNVFRVAKQVVGLNKDITVSECVKGRVDKNHD